jgi:hypothetical protein
MDPSEVRKEALELHEEVRSAMREALKLATRVQRGDLSVAKDLRSRAVELGNSLRRHAAVEEHDLGPVLQTLDSWGCIRRDQLEAIHDEQQRAWREAEAKMARAHEAPARDAAITQTIELARVVQTLVRSVLRTVRWEESHLLDPATLRDDIVSVDQIDG